MKKVSACLVVLCMVSTIVYASDQSLAKKTDTLQKQVVKQESQKIDDSSQSKKEKNRKYKKEKIREEQKSKKDVVQLACPISYSKHADGLPRDVWLSGNSIAYLIYTTTNEVIVITWLDINRKTLDGRVKSPEEEIFNRLMYFEACSVYKITIPDDAIMKDFDAIKAENGLSQAQLEQLFKDQLYSFQDGIEQRRMMYAISTLLGQFVAGRIIVTQEEIKKYYDDLLKGIIASHLSTIEKESFKIKRAFIPEGTFTDEELLELAEKQFYIGLLDWKTPYWIAVDEIADEKSFIKTMRKDDIYVEKSNGGHDVFMVMKHVPERVKSLEDMNKSIVQLLTEEKQKSVMEEYKKELFSRYTVVEL